MTIGTEECIKHEFREFCYYRIPVALYAELAVKGYGPSTIISSRGEILESSIMESEFIEKINNQSTLWQRIKWVFTGVKI